MSGTSDETQGHLLPGTEETPPNTGLAGLSRAVADEVAAALLKLIVRSSAESGAGSEREFGECLARLLAGRPGSVAGTDTAAPDDIAEDSRFGSAAGMTPQQPIGRHAAHTETHVLAARIHGWNEPNPMTPAAAAASLPATDLQQPAAAVVQGVECSRGHLNDPRVAFCASCGIRMNNRTAVPVQGRRPPLGLVLFDDGTIYVLDDDYLLGRRPDSDAAVTDGRLRALRLDDESGTLSRLHAEIRLHDWDAVLIDRGSANGTHVAGPKADQWLRLSPGEPFVLNAGTRVRIGHRTFTFQSARAEL